MGGGQLDIRPPQSKNWGGRVPPVPPRIDAPGFCQGRKGRVVQNIAVRPRDNLDF